MNNQLPDYKRIDSMRRFSLREQRDGGLAERGDKKVY
jgi:hypothetical protein